ncbi:cobyric acid synthase [Acrasis kona]|uniref:Cobyric acid synthase n=1 Tax=Acrasis kona TaxID=1008807 RepID=A0AAW2Z7Y3_9EUKA
MPSQTRFNTNATSRELSVPTLFTRTSPSPKKTDPVLSQTLQSIDFKKYKSTWDRINRMFTEQNEIPNSLQGLVFFISENVPSRRKLIKRIEAFKGEICEKDSKKLQFSIGTGIAQYHPDLVTYLTRTTDDRREGVMIEGFKASIYRSSKPFSCWTDFDLKYRRIVINTVAQEWFVDSLNHPSRHNLNDQDRIMEGYKALVDQYRILIRNGHYHHGIQTGQENQHELFCTALSKQFKHWLDKYNTGLRYYYEANVCPKDKFYGHGNLDIAIGPQSRHDTNKPEPILFFVECKSVLEKKKHLAQAVAKLLAVNWTNQSYEFPEEFPACHALLTDGVYCVFLMIHNVTAESVFVGITDTLQVGSFETSSSGQTFNPSEGLEKVMQIMYVLSNPELENPGVLAYKYTQDQVRLLSEKLDSAEKENARLAREIERLKRQHHIPQARKQAKKEGYFRSALNYVMKKLNHEC